MKKIVRLRAKKYVYLINDDNKKKKKLKGQRNA